jgi:hypothetical protein
MTVQKKYTFNIIANSDEKCNEIMMALNIIYKKANTEELIYLAKRINEKPALITKAVNALKVGLI